MIIELYYDFELKCDGCEMLLGKSQFRWKIDSLIREARDCGQYVEGHGVRTIIFCGDCSKDVDDAKQRRRQRIRGFSRLLWG